jgi:hypothetical protein
VNFQDLLIVSLGDSVASGEGSPDAPCLSTGCTTIYCGSSGCAKDAPTWQFTACHRSAAAGPGVGARRLEESDALSSVTFVHLACSGAGIRSGILGTYKGIETPPGGGVITPQIKVLERVNKARPVDAVLINVGANDVGFVDAVTECFLPGRCQNNREFVERIDRLLDGLPALYDRLAGALKSLKIPADRVHITHYFDPTRPAVECQWMLYGSELEWAYEAMVSRMNRYITEATKRHGWTLIDGIEEGFRGRGYCAEPRNRLIRTLVESLAMQGGIDGTFHPNWAGHVVYGDRIYGKLQGLLKD